MGYSFYHFSVKFSKNCQIDTKNGNYLMIYLRKEEIMFKFAAKLMTQ